jgi:hypothetical protein
MRVVLDKPTVLTLYCLSRQAERSVDRALGSRWEDFRAYYDSERTGLIESCRAKIVELAPAPVSAGAPLDRDAIVSQLPESLCAIMGFLFGRWRRRWRFKESEMVFFAQALTRLLTVLDEAVRPSQDFLISLRMDLWACTYVITTRCHGMRELVPASRITHFQPFRGAIEWSVLFPTATPSPRPTSRRKIA